MAILQTTAPSSTDKYWIHESYGGYNKCILVSGNSVLHNCTGFAWGCFAKAGTMKNECKLPVCDAENWIERNTAYKTGFAPKVGGIMVWAGGDIHSSADGHGHVAFVIKVAGDKVTILEDGYYRKTIITTTLSAPYNYGSMKYLGCIYHPTYIATPYEIGKTYKISHKGGLYVRTGAGLKYKIKKYKNLTSNAKKYAKFKSPKSNAVLKQGAKVTIQDIKKVGNDIWVKIPSGWIRAKRGKNKMIK